jgi:hypothetical protein
LSIASLELGAASAPLSSAPANVNSESPPTHAEEKTPTDIASATFGPSVPACGKGEATGFAYSVQPAWLRPVAAGLPFAATGCAGERLRRACT